MAIGAVVGLPIGYAVHRATGHSANFITWINPLSTVSHYWTDGLAWIIGGIWLRLIYLRKIQTEALLNIGGGRHHAPQQIWLVRVA